MKQIFQNINNEVIIAEISGKHFLKGNIIDSSYEMLVMHNGIDFIYLPFEHIQHIRTAHKEEEEIIEPMEPPTILFKNNKDLSVKSILSKAQGMQLEIYVTGKQPLHGYISTVMQDYFIFQSPIYKTVFIAQKHLKWIIPSLTNQPPYELSHDDFPVKTTNSNFAGTFHELVKGMKDQLVVFNLGKENNMIGKIIQVNGGIIEIRTARATEYLNLNHISTVHCV